MIRSQSEEQGVESERPNDEPMSKDFSRHQRRERRKSDKDDYESLFICRNTLKKSQDHLYSQRVARHIGGDSHVYEE